MEKKQSTPKIKSNLHPRNKNNKQYDFTVLKENHAELEAFIIKNKHGNETIDFADQKAVKALNKALLKTHYNISYWDIPENYLIPPIPGRADYIHHIADLLCSSNYGKIPTGQKIKCFDIGTGANCIYPIIGSSDYGWSFIGTDIDPVALESANKIIEQNPSLENKVECRFQKNTYDFFYGALKEEEQIDLSICNPPFHASAEDAKKGNIRKVSNLNKSKTTKTALNFAGQNNELWCVGGERKFLLDMVWESKKFATRCFWFSSLISKQSNIKAIQNKLKEIGATKIETIAMSTGNKSTRIIAWTFLDSAQQKEWANTRWRES